MGFSSWAGRRRSCMTFFGPSMKEKTVVEARARKISGHSRLRWVVVLVAGEHHVDGGLNSGGRWFGRGWSSSERAAKIKLRWGLDYWVQERATDEVWAPEVASPK